MERESTLELREGTKDSYHPGGLHKPIQWLKSSHCVSLLIMRMVFSPLDAFIRSFSYCMHSWYLLFSWHSKAGHMQFKGFHSKRPLTSSVWEDFQSHTAASLRRMKNQWSGLHWNMQWSHTVTPSLAPYHLALKPQQSNMLIQNLHFTMATTSCHTNI